MENNENKVSVLPESEEQSEGNLTLKRNKTVDLIAKIVCLLIAFFVWYYASSIDTVIYEEEFKEIPIEIINKSEYVILSGKDKTIDVTLSGTRQDIDEISKYDIKARVEIPKDAEAGENYYKIYLDIPAGLTLQKSSIEIIAVNIDNRVSKDVPVKVELINCSHTGAELIKETVENITVEGPEQIVSRIAYAELLIDKNGETVTESFEYSGELKLYDANNSEISKDGLKLSKENISAKVTLITERDVPVVLKFEHGLIGKNDYDVVFSVESIKMRGDASVLKNLKIECRVNEKTIKRVAKIQHQINIPEGIENISGINSVSVTVTLKNCAERTFTVIPTAVGGEALEPVSPIEVTLRGKTADIQNMTEASIFATVDLNGLESGNKEVDVKFSFSQEFSDKVYEVYSESNPYKVTVNVK